MEGIQNSLARLAYNSLPEQILQDPHSYADPFIADNLMNRLGVLKDMYNAKNLNINQLRWSKRESLASDLFTMACVLCKSDFTDSLETGTFLRGDTMSTPDLRPVLVKHNMTTAWETFLKLTLHFENGSWNGLATAYEQHLNNDVPLDHSAWSVYRTFDFLFYADKNLSETTESVSFSSLCRDKKNFQGNSDSEREILRKTFKCQTKNLLKQFAKIRDSEKNSDYKCRQAYPIVLNVYQSIENSVHPQWMEEWGY